MAYAEGNPRTKKELKARVVRGDKISVFNGFMNEPIVGKGYEWVEGPQYPEPHRWYAKVGIDDDGYITKVY